MLTINMLIYEFYVQMVNAQESPSEDEPTIEVIDFNNGTRQMIVDYRNGTRDYITETFTRETARFLLLEDNVSQSLPIELPTSHEESTEYLNKTQTVTIEQEILMGFTYTIAKERYTLVDIWVLTAYARAGINVDIQFGLRLPINVTVEYPEQMTIGSNYTFYATLIPIDKSSFNEFLFIFKAYVWVEAGIWVPFRWIKYSATYGPNYDLSRSFQTPLGLGAEAPLPGINIKIFDSAWVIEFSLLKVFLTIEPAFGSEKITAKAISLGDARVIKGADLTWSAPSQRLNFTVKADEYDNKTDYAKIRLSDFRYYFTIFKLHVGLLFDFDSWIDWLTGDPSVRVATLDMSWIIRKLGSPYLPVHPRYPAGVEVTIYVKKHIPPPQIIEPRDVAILCAEMYPETIYKGQILNITVIVKNFGNVTENINVTIHFDKISVKKQTITEFEPNQEAILVFLLDTSDWLLGDHTICAEASSVPYEIDITNNIFVVGVVHVVALTPLSASISPTSASIPISQLVPFTSSVTGGIPPYTYQWYLNDYPVSGGTSPIWTFTPTTSGIFYVYLKVADSKGNTVQSDVARIVVYTVPVGGYSIPMKISNKTGPLLSYIALILALTATLTKIRLRTRKKH